MELLSAELPMMPWNTYDSFEPEKGEGDEGDEGDEVDEGDEGDGNGEPFVAKVSTLEYFEKVSNFGQTVETPFVCKVSTFDFFEDGFHVPGTEYAAKVTPMASVVEPESPCHLRNVCNVCNVPTYCSFDGSFDGSFDSHGSCVAPSEPQKLSIFDSFTAMPPMPPMPPMHLPLQLPAGHCLLPTNMSAVKVDFSSNVSSDSTSSTPSAKSCASVPLHVENGESIHWNVDGRKLESQDKQILSPEFELQLPGVPETTPFRLMILAKETRGKGCRGFLKAKGRGRLFIKCGCSSVPESAAAVAFRVTVGAGTDAEKSKVLRPHQFADHSCCPLQEDKEDWGLLPAVSCESKHFEVLIEVLHADNSSDA